jgi:hypothetical protein|tara:strand:- start:3331 stop:4302 length:972 start_codon:yes stop_codon:yes gene_type:complete
MGIKDDYLRKRYVTYFDNYIEYDDVTSVAFLGWESESGWLVSEIKENCKNLLKLDFYDIITANGAKYWDINDDWDISGYDLIICFRTALFCKSAKHFCEQLPKLVHSNKQIIFDFQIGNPPIFLKDIPKQVRERILPNNDSIEIIFSWVNILTEERVGPMYLLPKFDKIYTSPKFLHEYGFIYNNNIAWHVESSDELLTLESLLAEENNILIDHVELIDTFNETCTFYSPVDLNDENKVKETLTADYIDGRVCLGDREHIRYSTLEGTWRNSLCTGEVFPSPNNLKLSYANDLYVYWTTPVSPLSGQLPEKSLIVLCQFKKDN